MRALCIAVLWAGCSAASGGEITLADVWHAALGHDPIFAAAQAQRDVGRARGAEAMALWLPTLTATGSAGRADLDRRTQGAYFAAPGFAGTRGVDFQTNVTSGTATRWAMVAEQPLYDADRFALSTTQRNAARMAEAHYRASEQDLMLRSARAYFEVLTARAQLQTLVRLRAAAERTRQETQARYEAGDIPVTDMREAQASADTLDVQELDVRNSVTLSEAAFTDLTGLDAADMGELPEAATREMRAPESLDAWTQRALSGSPLRAIQQLALVAATAQVKRYGALNSPRLSLVGQVGQDSLRGSGEYGSTDISGRQSSIGLELSIPLFTGGMRSAQRREARALEQQAEAELASTDQTVRQSTRAAWLAVTSASARVQALLRLRISAASRRDATRLGAQIGARTALELLSAEADSQRAEADFQLAQSDWILAGLQLKSVAGELTEADLSQIDRQMISINLQQRGH